MNHMCLMGRLTKDPELRKTPTGKDVASFRLAVPRPNNREKTDYITVTAWEKLGEFVAKNFSKGRKICVVGQMRSRDWEDAEGRSRSVVEMVADEIYFADSRRAEQTEQPQSTTGFEDIDIDDGDLPF